MYLFCLRKIREISHSTISPLVKLRLMENEENLFDGGLYIGIGGTAMALVLQVLGLVPANLLAAYSSNLFGITCVALVKIRHVRPYKRQLILDSQGPAPTMPATLVAPVAAKPQVAIPAAIAKSATPPAPPAAPSVKNA
jgi:predicted lipid-binding transport protein (Tim44 family)